ncbi:histone H3 K4-specific methyltransferase SET7/9family protein [Striga asiatica]|uniref:Histone H3 K4-specific methyltransferase SET7/9family protein n=1 Tax=Striga asiatica TaxID=4170 RepID=A0A5A7RDK5_STRAF|nr:histone H3 K4-specific methyltransferase SET7/9family protein [Striga asiatica]
MKIHPEPNKLNVALPYEVKYSSILAQSNVNRQKILRRLPHIFQMVLELPFHSDTNISISETPDSFRFSTAANHMRGDVMADTVKICPGVSKIVIKGVTGNEIGLDLWRFRLPDMDGGEYEDGHLVVTVPKGPKWKRR